MADANKLERAERELIGLISGETSRWQDIAKLLLRVEHEELWRAAATSYTAWLRELAARASLQPSSLWRSLKAARFYLDRIGSEDPEALSGAKPGAQALELAEKIARYAPDEIAEHIVERTLAGELKYADLYATWKAYRPAAGGDSARGRLPSDPDLREDALAQRADAIAAHQRRPGTRDALAAGEVMVQLRTLGWLGMVDQAHLEAPVHLAELRADAVAVVRRHEGSDALELHAVYARGTPRHLRDAPIDPAARHAADRLWLAVPTRHATVAAEAVAGYVGVLALRDAELHVVRGAKALRPDSERRASVLGGLLQRSYRWPEAGSLDPKKV